MLIDTHCHIHDKDYALDINQALDNARLAGVGKMITVGTDIESSILAVKAAEKYDNVFAAIGVHPHETKNGVEQLADLIRTPNSKIIAIGEIGLDYFYEHSPRLVQQKTLEQQLQLAIDVNLPVIFHIREGYDDFWPIINNFSNLRAVVHSFSDSSQNLELALAKGYYVGLNGLCTFVRDEQLIQTFKEVPLDRMLLETDAPYLTPKPFRGKINEPAYVKDIAEFIAGSRGLFIEEIAARTSENAHNLFKI